MKTSLTPAQKVSYLANVLSIAKPEEQMGSSELAVLQEIIDRLDVDWNSLQEAKKLVAGGIYSLRLMREAGVRRDNIEDMIAISLADGSLSDDETNPIEKMSETLGFSQADMDMIVRRAELRVQKLKSAPVNKHNQPPPEPPKKQKPVQKTPPPPPQTYTSYKHRPQESSASTPPAPPPGYTNPYAASPYASGINTKEAATGPVPVPELPPGVEEPAVDHVEACISQRAASDHPGEYCFGLGSDCLNIWGCRLMNLDWKPGSDWLSLGKFRDDNTFIFDRNAIKGVVEKHVEHVMKCPHLRIDYIEEVFSRLPARASASGRWRYREGHSDDRRAVQISASSYMHGQHIISKKTVVGMDPDGPGEALKIIRRSLRKTHTTDVDASLLQKNFEDAG